MEGLIMWKGCVQCSICGHIHNAMMPIEPSHSEPLVPLECNKCNNMACSPVEDDEGCDDEPEV